MYSTHEAASRGVSVTNGTMSSGRASVAARNSMYSSVPHAVAPGTAGKPLAWVPRPSTWQLRSSPIARFQS